MKTKIPKDIGLVVATKKEALWIKVRDAAISRISNAEDNIEIDDQLLEIAKKIIAEEHAL